MTKFENTKVFNFEGALRGMRNPLNSWHLADSTFEGEVRIGPNDMKLCKKLINGGSEHRKFLRQIFVSADITLPRAIFQEFDTYKIGTVANSCSTIHKGMEKEFAIEMFSLDHPLSEDDFAYWGGVLKYLNDLRKEYLSLDDLQKKNKILHKLKMALPEGFLQKRTWTANYEVVYNMYRQRKRHKMDEWSKDFISWAESLPYFKEFFLS